MPGLFPALPIRDDGATGIRREVSIGGPRGRSDGRLGKPPIIDGQHRAIGVSDTGLGGSLPQQPSSRQGQKDRSPEPDFPHRPPSRLRARQDAQGQTSSLGSWSAEISPRFAYSPAQALIGAAAFPRSPRPPVCSVEVL
jgi:hypothetical protein